MLACDLLRRLCADFIVSCLEISVRGPPSVRLNTGHTPWSEERLQCEDNRIGMCSPYICQDGSTVMIKRLPQPPLVRLIAHAAPPFVYCSCADLLYDDVNVLWYQTIDARLIHDWELRCCFVNVSMTVVGRLPHTRAVSRIPRPCSAISTSCRLPSGKNP
jgi:hypothetical protein